MPCPLEESLSQDLSRAMFRQDQSHSGSREKLLALGVKKTVQEREDTKRAVEMLEYRYNSHIASCDACKADGRSELHGTSDIG